jgi:serine/threonine-protein kinase
MIGKILGNRYEIVEKIAQGGMSTVYKALDTKLNRYDAVKVLKEEFTSNREILDRFKQEANAVAFLSHPNIVNIYNVGSEDNIHYIVMEYVRGKTLKQVIREKGKLSNDEILDYSMQIGRALECAHNNNIIHRDIKPQNIMITGDNLVKVTDFGIAKHSDSNTITHSGKIFGSAHYFSPEQARGNLTDRRSDIYSLGIVMFEMATGAVPFDAESPITIALKHMQEDIKPPKTINPLLAEGLNRVILKSTAKDPIARYQKIEEFLVDLRTVKAGENIESAATFSGETQIMSAVKPKRDPLEDDIFDDEKPTGKNKTALIVGLVMVVFLTLGALLGQFVFGGGTKNPTTAVDENATVPAITGILQSDAEKALADAGLVMQIGSTENSDQPEGTVLRSLPGAGESVRKGSTVQVVLSAGQVILKVPDVINMTLESAETLLANNNFLTGLVTEEYSDTVPQGQIISQEPLALTDMPKGSPVNIVISKGPELQISKVPNLLSLSETEARSLLESVKLVLGSVTKQPTGDKKLDGSIKSQEIPENTEVKQGSKVNVTVYEYREVLIGDFSGKTVAQYESELESMGLKVVLAGDTLRTDNVVDVNPNVGKSVPYGSTVEILGEPEPEPEPTAAPTTAPTTQP